MNLIQCGLPPELALHIERDIFLEYMLNDKGHQLPHIEYVIRRSLTFADRVPDINTTMVVVIAAYHDVAVHVDRSRHETLAAARVFSDAILPRFFTPEQIRIIAEAIEDHRGSLDHEPRSVYGRIVASADRSADMDDFLRRLYLYRLKTMPGASLDEIEADARKHVREKYGSNGYARKKMHFSDPEFDSFCKTAEILGNDPEVFHERFISACSL